MLQYACISMADIVINRPVIVINAGYVDGIKPGETMLAAMVHVCTNYTIKASFGHNSPVEVDYLTCAQCSNYTPDQSRPLCSGELASKGFCFGG